MSSIREQLSAIENRLAHIESQLGIQKPTSPDAATDHPPAAPPKGTPWVPEEDKPKRSLAVSTLLGWGGASALVLATAYLIQLALSQGWLTPTRQVVIAFLMGGVLIAAGIALRSRDQRYASYLPAGGIVILFLAAYGAHLYYPLIQAPQAIAIVIGICLLSLWLCRLFDSDLYAFFAVIGSYTVPLLFPQLRSDTLDLAIYFSAWSILFSAFSVIIGKRSILLLSLYLALIIFDLIWRFNHTEQWLQALIFQCTQLLIFGSATLLFSLRRKEPMNQDTAVLYLPALLIFYMLQYSLLQQHLPGWAPWIAAASALVLLLLSLIARWWLKQPTPGSRFLVSAYMALVLFHAGYLEALPDPWKAWAALLIIPVIAGVMMLTRYNHVSDWPVAFACLLIFGLNNLKIITDFGLEHVPGKDALYLLYPLEIYIGYVLSLKIPSLLGFRIPLLYAGHISLMSAAVYLFDERLAVSLAWGGLAIACLLIA
ncbi:MAG: DUF2339 domain-containing protein, partial [Mariprofundus sp.]